MTNISHRERQKDNVYVGLKLQPFFKHQSMGSNKIMCVGFGITCNYTLTIYIESNFYLDGEIEAKCNKKPI